MCGGVHAGTYSSIGFVCSVLFQNETWRVQNDGKITLKATKTSQGTLKRVHCGEEQIFDAKMVPDRLRTKKY